MSASVEPQVVYTHLDVEGCAAELYLNDIPLDRLVAGEGRRRVESTAAHQYLFDGENRLELLVEPGSTPARARTELRERKLTKAHAAARLVRYADGADLGPENGAVLAEVTFRSEDPAVRAGEPASVGPAYYPRSFFTTVDLGRRSGRWAFQDAPALTLDDALVAEARAVLDEVASAVKRGDAAAFLSLLSDQHADVLQAYPAFTPGRIRDDIAEYVAFFHRAAEPVAPRVPERHSFRLAGSGRLLHCLDDDWQGSVRMRSPDDGGISPYPLFLARLGGRLRIVR